MQPVEAQALSTPTVSQLPSDTVAADPLAQAEGAALATARATGQPVAVSEETSENAQVTANPDGTLTLDSSRTAVRVKRGSTWVPIDTSLHGNADGSLSPNATTTQIKFSGGGNGPAATIIDPNGSIAATLPVALPIPTVADNTATYHDVLPGTDLALTAHAESYSSVLIVHDAQAAANPLLAHLQLIYDVTGLNLVQAADHSVTATNAAGERVFTSSPPVMWDSTFDGRLGNEPTAFDPESGITHTLDLSGMSVRAADAGSPQRTTATLSPPPAALVGSGVTYPVYIDPTVDGSRDDFVVVRDNPSYPDYYNNTDDFRVGYCQYSGGSASSTCSYHSATYFTLKLDFLIGRSTEAKVYSADLYVRETYNAVLGCASTPVSLYGSQAFDPATTNYPGPYQTELQRLSSNAGGDGSTCQPADLDFNSASLVSRVQDHAHADYNRMALALMSPNINDKTYYKKFANDPHIRVTYQFPEPTPTALKVTTSGVACDGELRLTDHTPAISAVGTDYNGQVPKLDFQVVDVSSGNVITAGSASSSTGNPAVYTAAPLPDDHYGVRVRSHPDAVGSNPIQYSAWTAYTYFYVDTVKPPAPSVSTFDYPYETWGAQQNQPGATFTLRGSADVIGYAYGWDSASNVPSGANTCDLDQVLGTTGGYDSDGTLTPPSGLVSGRHVIYTRAIDSAHNLSTSSAAFAFYISTNIGNSKTRFEGEAQSASTIPGAPSAQTYNTENLGGSWSGSHHSHFLATAVGQEATYTIQVEHEGDYAVTPRLTQASHYGIVSFQIDGTTLVGSDGTVLTFDGYSATSGAAWRPLGGVHLVAGSHTFTIHIEGRNASAVTNYSDTNVSPAVVDNGFSAGLDLLVIAPVTNFTAASFEDAMNNQGIILTDNSTPASQPVDTKADLAFASSKANLSRSALIAAGFATSVAGLTKTGPDGTTFTIPPPHTVNGKTVDNVVATGQTIPIPGGDTFATSVDLLVVATCATLNATPGAQTPSNSYGNQATINYVDATGSGNRITSNQLLPEVPNWYDSPASHTLSPSMTPFATLDHADNGTTPNTSTPTLYHWSIPVPSNYRPGGAFASQVHSLTVPNLATNFQAGTCSPAMHVLAMTTR